MAAKYAVIVDEKISIPTDAFTYEGFHRWCFSKSFPETGRIDYITGTIHLELNEVGEGAEDLFTHNAVLMAIGTRLHSLVTDKDLGEVFSKGVRGKGKGEVPPWMGSRSLPRNRGDSGSDSGNPERHV
jgi:hypothetical protein